MIKNKQSTGANNMISCGFLLPSSSKLYNWLNRYHNLLFLLWYDNHFSLFYNASSYIYVYIFLCKMIRNSMACVCIKYAFIISKISASQTVIFLFNFPRSDCGLVCTAYSYLTWRKSSRQIRSSSYEWQTWSQIEEKPWKICSGFLN